MLLNLIENQNIKKTTVTIEYREKDEQLNKIIDFVEHIDEMENSFSASANGQLFHVSINEFLYIESVDRKTFGYTSNEVYELGFKLYEIEERYHLMDYIRISKSCIVNLKKVLWLLNLYVIGLGRKLLASLLRNTI